MDFQNFIVKIEIKLCCNVVRPVKEIVKSTLAEFIRRGTYKGNKLQYEDRNGTLRDFPEYCYKEERTSRE